MNGILMRTLAAVLAAAAALPAQGPGCGWRDCPGCWAAGFPSGSLTELRGQVAAVQLMPGMGMPTVTVKTGNDSKLVFLGSIRYLMMQGFNPKVDEDIVIQAYEANGRYFAATVTLPARNQTIRLRDADGRPVWRRGPRW